MTDFDINKFILSKTNRIKNKYDLFAVANHYGTLHYGHYTAYCKNSINNKWYEFNDSCVSEITDESKIISSSAYVLFYRQQGLAELNWKNIYNKQFMNINIDDNKTLVDFYYDFNCENDKKNDGICFDGIINESFKIKSEEDDSKTDAVSKEGKKNEISFLGRKREFYQ